MKEVSLLSLEATHSGILEEIKALQSKASKESEEATKLQKELGLTIESIQAEKKLLETEKATADAIVLNQVSEIEEYRAKLTEVEKMALGIETEREELRLQLSLSTDKLEKSGNRLETQFAELEVRRKNLIQFTSHDRLRDPPWQR